MITVKDLSKFYGGKKALGPVSFDIADGETIGFLGLNGAGKTTALRILACDLRPSSGSVRIGDIDAVRSPHEVRKQVGFLPENPPLHGDMRVDDYLTFAGRIRQMSPGDVRRRLPEVLEVTSLKDVADELVRNLSHGYRQRVGVAQAIIHKPKLLILDEPTRGLDPVQIVEMRSLVRDLKQAHTVLISSHILTEISETCDRILVLGAGAILATGSEAELSSSLLETRRFLVAARPAGRDALPAGPDALMASPDAPSAKAPEPPAAREALMARLRGVAGVTEVLDAGEEDGAPAFEVIADEDVRPALCRALVEAGDGIVKVDRSRRQLETIFLKLVQGGDDAGH